MAATTSKGSKAPLNTDRLEAHVGLLLQAPEADELIKAVRVEQEIHAAYVEIRHEQSLFEAENGVSADVLRRPDLQTRHARDVLDELHDLAHQTGVAASRDRGAQKAVNTAAAAVANKPSTRRWLAGLVTDVADQYKAAVEAFVDAETDLLTLRDAVTRAGLERRVKQEALAISEGEYRKVPGDNARQARRFAEALRAIEEPKAQAS